MRVTSGGFYALKALVDMYKHSNGYMPSHVVVERQNISQHYLEQIFRKLRVAGILEAKKGTGYRLADPSGQTNVMTILNAVESNFNIVKATRSYSLEDNIVSEYLRNTEVQFKALYTRMTLKDLASIIPNELNSKYRKADIVLYIQQNQTYTTGVISSIVVDKSSRHVYTVNGTQIVDSQVVGVITPESMRSPNLLTTDGLAFSIDKLSSPQGSN